MAHIVMRLRPDGTIEAVTHGLKGDACLPYINTVEQLTEAQTVHSYETHEFREQQQIFAPAPDGHVDIYGG